MFGFSWLLRACLNFYKNLVFSALAWIFSGRALALCGEALNILEFFGPFWGNAKKDRAVKLTTRNNISYLK